MHDLNSVTQFLYSLRNKGSKYGLVRMRRFAKALHNPEKALTLIHVAGTNGKGSVCAMLEAIYRSNGYKTGLFTSPHLIRLNERIQINRVPISDQDLANSANALITECDKQFEPNDYPSFFEFITAIAFSHFSKNAVDIAIIETGLGGRLDATNIINPELSIITSIGKDHTDILGDTLEAITQEKAGIIKPNTPVLIGKLPDISKTIIKEKADALNSEYYTLENYSEKHPLPTTNLKGTYQKQNAVLASYATKILADRFPIKHTQALNQVKWEGRWQKLKLKKQTLILDSTHNAEACLQLEENLRNHIAESGKKPIIITGILGRERAGDIMPLLSQFAKSLYLVEPDQPRSCSAETLTSLIPKSQSIQPIASRLEQLFSENSCQIGDETDTILVTGSIYLIAEVLTILEGHTKDPIGQDLIQ
ncbi:MAG: bifunctional folylpolyglutamate synthase/dihydrofolate synthase [Coraliomargaritaceae bacterium]